VVTTNQIRALVMSALTPAGTTARISALLRHRGYVRSLTAPLGGRLNVAWYEESGAAHGHRTLVARVTVTLGDNRPTAIRNALTRAGVKLLTRADHLTLLGKGTLSLSGIGAVSVAVMFGITR
jgi:hypothetical protein